MFLLKHPEAYFPSFAIVYFIYYYFKSKINIESISREVKFNPIHYTKDVVLFCKSNGIVTKFDEKTNLYSLVLVPTVNTNSDSEYNILEATPLNADELLNSFRSVRCSIRAKNVDNSQGFMELGEIELTLKMKFSPLKSLGLLLVFIVLFVLFLSLSLYFK